METAGQVHASITPGSGLRTRYDWLVLFLSMLGSKWFAVACFALFFSANNPCYLSQVEAWKRQGQLGPKPRSGGIASAMLCIL